jgi:hypothetical protein
VTPGRFFFECCQQDQRSGMQTQAVKKEGLVALPGIEPGF